MSEHEDHIFPGPVDLTALDPRRDGPRFDSMIRSITVAAMAERARLRQESNSTFAPVVAWGRATLAAAAVILIIAGSALVAVPVPTAAAAAPESLAESAGVPASVVALASTNRAVTASELVDTFDSLAVSTRGR